MASGFTEGLVTGRKQSEVWTYFTQTDATRAMCKVCGVTVSRGSRASTVNTSCMWNHLQRNHPHYFLQLRNKKLPPKQPLKVWSRARVKVMQQEQEEQEKAAAVAATMGTDCLPQNTSTASGQYVTHAAAATRNTVEGSPSGREYDRGHSQPQCEPQCEPSDEPSEEEVAVAGRAFLGVLFGPDNYRRWIRLRRESRHDDTRAFVHWLLTLAQSAIDTFEDPASGEDMDIHGFTDDNGAKTEHHNTAAPTASLTERAAPVTYLDDTDPNFDVVTGESDCYSVAASVTNLDGGVDIDLEGTSFTNSQVNRDITKVQPVVEATKTRKKSVNNALPRRKRQSKNVRLKQKHQQNRAGNVVKLKRSAVGAVINSGFPTNLTQTLMSREPRAKEVDAAQTWHAYDVGGGDICEVKQEVIGEIT